MNASTAVLLLAHGTPNTLGEMSEYLSHVTGGRALPPEVVQELQHRYAEIGLTDHPGPEPPPLTRWTLIQAALLEQALSNAGHPLHVYAAMRNWHPFIADVVKQIRAGGVTHLVVICLAPQNSRTSIGLYRRALNTALAAEAAAPEIAVTFVESWSDEPSLIAAFAQRLTEACTRLAPDASASIPVLFTAHSVPCRTIQSPTAGSPTPTGMQSYGPATSPDPYPVEAKRTAELVFETAAPRTPALREWYFAFQSQGVAGAPWIGPTVEDTLTALAAEGHRTVILQPIGFLCDHVEILYDIDIAFAETARSLNLRLSRPESLNDSPLLTQALLHVVESHLAKPEPYTL